MILVVGAVTADHLVDVIVPLVVDPILHRVEVVVTTLLAKTTAASVTTIGVTAIALEAQTIEIVK